VQSRIPNYLALYDKLSKSETDFMSDFVGGPEQRTRKLSTRQFSISSRGEEKDWLKGNM
jgi:hypothetical protein